jgi:hypothetical protein
MLFFNVCKRKENNLRTINKNTIKCLTYNAGEKERCIITLMNYFVHDADSPHDTFIHSSSKQFLAQSREMLTRYGR